MLAVRPGRKYLREQTKDSRTVRASGAGRPGSAHLLQAEEENAGVRAITCRQVLPGKQVSGALFPYSPVGAWLPFPSVSSFPLMR